MELVDMVTGRSEARTGDPARTLELLWREPGDEHSGRGPRPGLSVDTVVRAAIALADAEGLDAVTMRRVAERLDFTPMSLYTYVPGKAELLALMLDRVYLWMPRTFPAPGGGWRERVAAVADENHALYEAHLWVAGLPTVRPPLGPGVMTKYEHELRAFDGLGLTDVQMDSALAHVLGFVQSVARGRLDVRTVERESAQSDAEWWEQHGPLLARVLDSERFPLAHRVGGAAAMEYGGPYSAEYAYAFGLRCVLDGLSALIDG
ncbi:TetR/AcrR family transcriptional regulator [Streptomyces uncialis]|uniref:TetR/AcrR family transcriptional regulator n=1 Tax=Streptomyces uncialis TaxID=1048205 RepID=UPI0038078824